MSASRIVLLDVVQHHLDEAAFLWQARQGAASSAEYALADLAALDERLQAHLEGLRIALQSGWHPGVETFEENTPGAVFVATWLLLKLGDTDKVIAWVERHVQEPPFRAALLGGFCWVSPAYLQGVVRSLLISPAAEIKRFGIESCIVHDVDPGTVLASCLVEQDAALCICAVQSCAALGLINYRPAMVRLLSHDRPDVRVAAAGALLLLGDRVDALQTLNELVGSMSLTEDVAASWVRAVTTSRANELLKALSSHPKGRTLLIKTVAGNGDPHYALWLLREMQEPTLARLAGYAFEAITGADIRREASVEAPRGQPMVSADSADHDIGIDEQTDLPWPDLGKLHRWWEQNRHRCPAGARLLWGRPQSVAVCVEILKQGNQRQRGLAGRQLILLKPGTPVFNIQAPAWRQSQKLSVACFGTSEISMAG